MSGQSLAACLKLERRGDAALQDGLAVMLLCRTEPIKLQAQLMVTGGGAALNGVPPSLFLVTVCWQMLKKKKKQQKRRRRRRKDMEVSKLQLLFLTPPSPLQGTPMPSMGSKDPPQAR
jgi:hypothetical protein